MVKRRDLSAPGQIQRNEQRLRRRERQTDLFASSVSDGEARFNGNESLKVFGSAVVYGWLIITGTLKLVGNLVMEGILTATGAVKLNGPVEITDTLSVSALTTILADLVVAAGGSITAGGLTITPTGDLEVGPGGRIVAGGLVITPSGEFQSATNLVINAPTVRFEAGIQVAGGNSVNLPLTYKAGSTPNVFIDSAGRLWSTTP